MMNTQTRVILTVVVKATLLPPAGQFCKITIFIEASIIYNLASAEIKMSGTKIKQP